MKNIIPILIIIISFSACTKRDNRKVVDDVENLSKTKKEIKTIDIADLPILIDSTSYLVHPIGNYSIEKDRSEYSYKRSENLSVVNYSGNRITGNISNIKFQDIDSNELISLTEETLNIKSMMFLRDVFEKTEKGYFIYNVFDKDTNADGELNSEDLRSLYMSNLNGTAFRKLSPSLQDVNRWKVITEANKLYFKSIEDIDKNGEFDKKDKTHYFYLDLSNKNSKVVEYFPI